MVRPSGKREQYEYESALVIPRGLSGEREGFPGELRIEQQLRSCCDVRLLESHKVTLPVRSATVVDTLYTVVEVPAGVLPPPVAAVSVPLYEANVSFVRPVAESVKLRSVDFTMYITYPVNRHEVYPDFERNRIELERVERLLNTLLSDTTVYSITGIGITGYASPEATWQHNLNLTRKRAEGMQRYLMKSYRLGNVPVTAEGKGEDWAGLRKSVAESDMSYRNEILSIIDNYGVFNSREKRLMELGAGEPYRYMLQHLFPLLRRMEMTISYTVKSFSPDEVEALIDERPQDLSLQEIYSLARSQNSNSTILYSRSDYGREWDIAVRYFPDDAVANINASSAALVRGDLELAWLCLSKVKDNSKAYNNLGVYCWLCGKIDEAKSYFRKAMDVDPVRAAHNLEQMRQWEENLSGSHNQKED